LEPYNGNHPDAIVALQEDLAAGKIQEPLRESQDIRTLLAHPGYRISKLIARIFLAGYWPVRTFWKALRNRIFTRSQG
jgi:hypothetical protein